jgi:hypothetical protein
MVFEQKGKHVSIKQEGAHSLASSSNLPLPPPSLASSAWRLLLGMGPEVVETVLFVFNGEVEPPMAIHARLPEAERFILLFGS